MTKSTMWGFFPPPLRVPLLIPLVEVFTKESRNHVDAQQQKEKNERTPGKKWPD